VNPRLAPYADLSEKLRHFTIFGIGAARITSAVTGLPEHVVSGLPAYGHLPGSDAGVRVARSPELLLDTFDLFVNSESALRIWQQALDAGARGDAGEAWEIGRVEAGRPEWGLDMDEGTLPQEANMDELQAISYTKGCYIGQEVVARIHFRGHVNRHLRGVVFSAEQLAPRGAALVAPDGKVVGDVRSGVDSPRFGRIALAMIRREVATGDLLMASHDGVEIPVRVVPLPFTA
jgi:tRNA-modifying protein YgfZ